MSKSEAVVLSCLMQMLLAQCLTGKKKRQSLHSRASASIPQDCFSGLQVEWAVRVPSGLEDELKLVCLALFYELTD